MSRFKREHSAGATLTTTTFFSFSSLFVAFFFVRARTRGATIVVYAFFFAFLFDEKRRDGVLCVPILSLGGVSLFQKSLVLKRRRRR